jgi:hypothetical protein
MTMEDAKLHNKDIYVMYADFKGAFNAASCSNTCANLVCPPPLSIHTNTTDYITPHGPTPSTDINRGTLQGDTMSPFLFTLFLEPFLR